MSEDVKFPTRTSMWYKCTVVSQSKIAEKRRCLAIDSGWPGAHCSKFPALYNLNKKNKK